MQVINLQWKLSKRSLSQKSSNVFKHENKIKNCFEKCRFGKPDIVADETFDHEFCKVLQELCSNATVKEYLELDDCINTCEPVVNTLSVNLRQELRATFN